jgi:cytochrome c peroxidase
VTCFAFLSALAVSALVAAPVRAAPSSRPLQGPAPVPVDELPADFPAEALFGLPDELTQTLAAQDQAVVALGRRLFFDPLLSGDETVACASCHQPARGFADATPLSIGVHGRRTLRNTPTLVNRALGGSFMWDGRSPTLEAQVLLPIENELEMDISLDHALERLSTRAPYPELFVEAFGRSPERTDLAAALAAFVRRVTADSSPYDHFLAGSFDALTPTERTGLWLFESRGGCWRCHPPPLFTDEEFHATGIGVRAEVAEEGRMQVTGEDADRGRFKTPTLRALVHTAPYMHDGSLASLEEVVEYYRRGGNPHPQLDPRLVALQISDQEAASLVAFLRVLSRRLPTDSR